MGALLRGMDPKTRPPESDAAPERPLQQGEGWTRGEADAEIAARIAEIKRGAFVEWDEVRRELGFD